MSHFNGGHVHAFGEIFKTVRNTTGGYAVIFGAAIFSVRHTDGVLQWCIRPVETAIAATEVHSDLGRFVACDQHDTVTVAGATGVSNGKLQLVFAGYVRCEFRLASACNMTADFAVVQ